MGTGSRGGDEGRGRGGLVLSVFLDDEDGFTTVAVALAREMRIHSLRHMGRLSDVIHAVRQVVNHIAAHEIKILHVSLVATTQCKEGFRRKWRVAFRNSSSFEISRTISSGSVHSRSKQPNENQRRTNSKLKNHS